MFVPFFYWTNNSPIEDMSIPQDHFNKISNKEFDEALNIATKILGGSPEYCVKYCRDSFDYLSVDEQCVSHMGMIEFVRGSAKYKISIEVIRSFMITKEINERRKLQ